jgi:hypothetical protein
MCSGFIAGRNPSNPAFEFSPATNARLSMIRALDQSGHSNSIDLARALHYAFKIKAQVVSCSWGGGSDTQGMYELHDTRA